MNGRTCFVRYLAYMRWVVTPTSSVSRYLSRSWSTVAAVRGLRRSSIWASNLVRAASASVVAFGPGGITSTRLCRFPLTGSTPA
ncbi:MAG: hypothetical protein EKK42_31355 [Pseudonocardiaceae bacterium]|nr:MAG: hypothetical protein EKK42_31355 [Pseudonocardiaceae bacterium]